MAEPERSFEANTRGKGTILGAVIISVAFHLVSALATYCALRALVLDIPLGSVLFVSMVVNVVSLAPISINGWGASGRWIRPFAYTNRRRQRRGLGSGTIGPGNPRDVILSRRNSLYD